MEHIGIISASGLGDALLMGVAASYFRSQNIPVTIFHPKPEVIENLFDPSIEIVSTHEYHSYHPSLWIIQCDHSDFYYESKGKLAHCAVSFHSKPSPTRRDIDFLANPHVPIAQEVYRFCKELLPSSVPFFRSPLQVERLPIQYDICIHVGSANPSKNWPIEYYLSLATMLNKLGKRTQIIGGKGEEKLLSQAHSAVICRSTRELKELLLRSHLFIGNDSGPGHLASALGIPTITIGKSRKQLTQWRPSFAPNMILYPLIPLPNWKGIGLAIRDNHWQFFVSPKRVLRSCLLFLREHHRF